MSKIVDLRSDTVTQPLPGMKEAMMAAPLGDDVYQEDPSINAFESRIAELLGMEAAMIVPSGTMSNFCAMLMHCQRGEEVILGDASHINTNEGGNTSVLGGIYTNPIRNNLDGTIDLDQLKKTLRNENVHWTKQKWIALENTHNFCGGRVLKPEYIREVSSIAKENGLSLHIDGARFFNGYYALKAQRPELTVAEFVGGADSVSLCFSKGLSCPVGSVLVSSSENIHRARRWRKAMGGGMRQAGLLAAAMNFALDASEEVMTKDHANAQTLSNGLKEMGFTVSPVDTNIVMFVHEEFDNTELINKLKEQGVIVGAINFQCKGYIRAVLHSGISSDDVDIAVERFRAIVCPTKKRTLEREEAPTQKRIKAH